MADSPDQDSDGWLTPWERKCLEEWDKEAALEERTQAETERCEQKVWLSFQNSASSITQLYKEGSHCSPHQKLWIPFQTAAGAATILYKDSQDMLRRSFELGSALGTHRRTKELLAWARRQHRRHLTRDELIAWVCGRPAPPPGPSGGGPAPRGSHRATGGARGIRGEMLGAGAVPPRYGGGGRAGFYAAGGAGMGGEGPDLTTFRDALAFQGLNGAMSNVTVGRRPPQQQPSNPRNSPLRCPLGGGGPTGGAGSASHPSVDLHGFLVEQLVRHSGDSRKRAASSGGEGRGGGGGSESPGGGTCKRNRMDMDDY